MFAKIIFRTTSVEEDISCFADISRVLIKEKKEEKVTRRAKIFLGSAHCAGAIATRAPSARRERLLQAVLPSSCVFS